MTQAIFRLPSIVNNGFQSSVLSGKFPRSMTAPDNPLHTRAEARRGYLASSPYSHQSYPESARPPQPRQDAYDPFYGRPHETSPLTRDDIPRSRSFDPTPFAPSEPRNSYETPMVLSDDPKISPGEPISRSVPNISLRRHSGESYENRSDSPSSQGYAEYEIETHGRRSGDMGRNPTRYQGRRRPVNQDEFDGPSQLLPIPLPQHEHARSQTLPTLPVSLDVQEQDQILQKAQDVLCACAYHFVAKYQFPIPIERDKPRVRSPSDREWSEWAYLLKRLATKRRIPARVLYDNRIKQLVTTLENSIPARQTPNKDRPTPRVLRDDRYVLQLISAGIQMARILMDSFAMQELDALYTQTEAVILDRRRMARQIHPPPSLSNF